MKKYYVEFLSINDWETEEQYFAQSRWFDTIDECLKFVEKWVNFHTINFDYQVFTKSFRYFLMFADFYNEKDYGDIDQVGEIIYNEQKHKFELVK